MRAISGMARLYLNIVPGLALSPALSLKGEGAGRAG